MTRKSRFHNPTKLTKSPSRKDKIKTHIVSYDELDQLDLRQPIDDVFCAIGTTIKAAGSVESFKKVDRDYVYE